MTADPFSGTGYEVTQARELRVESIEHVATDVVSIALVAPGAEPLPPWEPGAHIDLCLGNGLVRQYSLCGSPADDRRWLVAVLRAPDGRGGSDWVHTRLRAGELVTVRGPRNRFRLAPAGRYIFIAGGIGVTPLLPMVEALQRGGADWQLFYGGRSRATMAYLPRLAATEGRVTVVPEDECGMLDLDHILAEPGIGVRIYACGPPGLLAAVEYRCRSWPPGALHVERFHAEPSAEPVPDSAFEVEARQSGVFAEVPPGRTIVEVLEEHNVFVQVSCGEGVCGTCISTVLEGEPDHRDAVLTEGEHAAGELITPCCSRARTSRIVLDL
jgi:ferredoxin-NADP reductase